MATRIRVKEMRMVPADLLEPHPGNFRVHTDDQRAAMDGVLNEVGFAGAVLVREIEGGRYQVLDGHLRVEEMRGQQVPVLVTDLSEGEARKVLATFDAVGAMAEVDMGGLRALVDGLEWGNDAIEKMLAETLGDVYGGTIPDPNSDPDDDTAISRAEELRLKWKTELGQRWQLGEHLLICGDSLKLDERGDCQTLIFDPEWNEMPETIPGFKHVLAFGDGATIGDVFNRYGSPTWLFAWDCVTSWYTPNRPLRRMKLCAWYGPIEDYQFDGWHYGDAGVAHDVENTRGKYHYNPDPRGKHLSDIFQTPITRLHSESEHSHSKPLDWVSLLIGNCTCGDVYDPYAGSGTSIIACERLGRACRAMEIDPAYVAVALERWSTMTGGKPRLVETEDA